MGRTYGYARVSSMEQNLGRQVEALLEYGVEERDIVTDKQSGKDFQRRGYLALKNQMLRPGDTLVIKEMDRLGRDYGAIKDEWLDNYAEVIDLWQSNQITAVEAMKRLGMKKTTFYKFARRLTNK